MSTTMPSPGTTRSSPRFAAWLGARIEVAGAVHEATVLSLSSRGLFVATEAGVPYGVSVGVAMRVPEVGPLAVRARAIYAATCQGQRGYGLLLEPGADVGPAVDALRAWHEEYTWFPAPAGRSATL